MRAARALRQLPVVLEQVLEIVVAPFCWRGGPCHFEAAGDGVACDAGGVGACPAEALLLNRGAFRLFSQLCAGGCSVSLAEGVAAGDQGDGFFVVHRHSREGLTNILGCLERIGNPFRAFRIHINEPHRGGTVWTREIALTRIAFVCSHPGGLMPPVDVEIRFPNVGTSAGETKRLEAHSFEGDITGEDHEVGPRDLFAVLLLDRPQQAPRSIEVYVVRPAVEWSETLLASAAAAATVKSAIRTGAVPRHTNEQRSVVAEVGRPPVLRVGH